ncbi:MAG: hypothetical protein U1E27_11570, partial [Kiritimatiellia bacterium]|nr:hypothetical protein [Kiritimatiellia bacterium]
MSEKVSKSRAQRTRRAGAASRGKPTRYTLLFSGAVLSAAALLLISLSEPLLPGASLDVGQKSVVTLLAAQDFTCVDLDRTELARRQAAETPLPVFEANLMRVQEGVRLFHRFMDRVRQRIPIAESPDDLIQDIQDLVGLTGVVLEPSDVLRIARKPAPVGPDTLLEVLQTLARRGILGEEDRESRFQGIASTGSIWLDRGPENPPAERKLAEIPLPAEAAAEAARRLQETPPWDEISEAGIRRLIEPWLAPNLSYQQAVTDRRRLEAARSVQPVMRTVRAGATLIEAGDLATAQTLEMLREHNRKMLEGRPPFHRALNRMSDFGMALLATALVGVLIALFETRHQPVPRSRTLFVCASILNLVGVRALLWMSQSGVYVSPSTVAFALPLSISVILITILSDRATGLISGLWVALIASIFMGRDYGVLLVGLFSAGVAAWACRSVRQRGQIFQAGLWIGAVRAALALLADLPAQQPPAVLAARVAAALGIGLAESALILLLIPLFEFALRMTSNIRLLELSDPGHPLLRRLAEEAPG